MVMAINPTHTLYENEAQTEEPYCETKLDAKELGKRDYEEPQPLQGITIYHLEDAMPAQYTEPTTYDELIAAEYDGNTVQGQRPEKLYGLTMYGVNDGTDLHVRHTTLRRDEPQETRDRLGTKHVKDQPAGENSNPWYSPFEQHESVY
jgi:hypothetical protein